MFSQFLCSVVLAGIFSAVSELLLPSRLSSLGRLLRAVIAVWIVFLMASPILSFVLGRDAEDLLASVSLSEEQEGEQGSLSPEGAITSLAAEQLESVIQAELESLWNVSCCVDVDFSADINRFDACIYCDSPPQKYEETLCALGERYGTEFRLEQEGGGTLG
ncbi:MAG: hypothetical protein IJF24_01710 [Clostridia bacterium]|nr:hypothetical protein [Clostridia bacterium]